jgi:hypothetical protein
MVARQESGMGADVIVHLVCEAKRVLGGGDPIKGTLEIVQMLKARSRAVYVGQRAREEGIPLAEASVTVIQRTADGDEEVSWLVVDMLAEAIPLESHKDGCATCTANVKNEPYGCVLYVGYAVPISSERWVMDQLEVAGDLGWSLCTGALREFGYDGAPIVDFREQGLFEGEDQIIREIDGTPVGSNQVFQAIFAVGNHLDPYHCMGVLLWLGLLEVDGLHPTELRPGHIQALVAMSSARERRRRVVLRIERSDDLRLRQTQLMLGCLFSAFVNGVGVLVDA